MTTQRVLGSIVSLWRYPVKSMMDSSDAKVASAKNPRKWPQLFDFRAALADAPRTWVKLPSVRITLPDGTLVKGDQPDINLILSNALKREVKFESSLAEQRTATAEEYWPDIEGLDQRRTSKRPSGYSARRRSSVAVVSRCTTAQPKNVPSGKPKSVTVYDGFNNLGCPINGR